MHDRIVDSISSGGVASSGSRLAAINQCGANFGGFGKARGIVVEEGLSAQSTMRRLVEAEKQAREILKAAEERAKKSIVQAQEQEKQRLDTARRETDAALRARLDEVASKAAAEMKARLDEAESEALEIERRANERLPMAVEMVVNWVTGEGG